MTPLSLIVAVAENGVIGEGNSLPWHISSDLKRFRALTMGKPLVMGRRTFDSIGRALPGRETIVVTRNPDFAAEGVHAALSIEAALAFAELSAQRLHADEIMIVGGTAIFAALIDRAAHLYVTFVHAAPEGDAYFPPIDWAQWREIHREAQPLQKGDDIASTFVEFVRRAI